MIKYSIAICFTLIAAIQVCFSQEKVNEDLRIKVKGSAASLNVRPPDQQSPVSMGATAVWSDNEEQLAIVMKVEVLDSWHIYAYVPDTQPYIQSEIKLTIPDEITPLDEWETPDLYPSSDGVYVYKGNLVFVRYFSVDKPLKATKIDVGLFYQTCDINQCLPPTLESKEVIL